MLLFGSPLTIFTATTEKRLESLSWGHNPTVSGLRLQPTDRFRGQLQTTSVRLVGYILEAGGDVGNVLRGGVERSMNLA